MLGKSVHRTAYSIFNVLNFYAKFDISDAYTEVHYLVYSLWFLLNSHPEFYDGFTVGAICNLLSITYYSFSVFGMVGLGNF